VADSKPRGPGKRERLVGSAAKLVHRQGIERTTLAQVAADADVPLGNVYYYFKTRDDLLRAVVDARLAEVRQFLAGLDSIASPEERLRALATSWTTIADEVVDFGCPIGGLTAELVKHGGAVGECRAVLLREIVGWAQEQYRELGHSDPSSEAESLIARIQGAALVASAFGDRDLLDREFASIEHAIRAPEVTSRRRAPRRR